MLRPDFRDEVRALAEVPGSTTLTGLINRATQDAINALTALAKYEELYTIDDVVTIAANGIATLPSTVQHLDKDNVYFLQDNDINQRRLLWPFSRVRSITNGPARQWRIYGEDFSGLVRKIQITPFDLIDTTADKLYINYWRYYVWNTDDDEFGLPRLEETLKLKVAARIAKTDNPRRYAKLRTEAREAYIAMRAGVY